MKAYMLIANWLVSFLFLSYSGDSLIIAFLVTAYFAFSCYGLTKNYRMVYRRLYAMNRYIDKLIGGRE